MLRTRIRANWIAVDWAANRGDHRSQLALVLFRICRRLRTSDSRTARHWGRVVSLLYLVLVEWTWGVELPWSTNVGPGLVLMHGTGVVINGDSVLGSSVVVHQNVCIGARNADGGSPVLGDRVRVGAGAIILGSVAIGDDATIGAGSVVLCDVPRGRTAVGNPARVI